MPGTVVTRGARELSLRFETLPERAGRQLETRISDIVGRLEVRIEQVVPTRRGQLRSEIASRTYKGNDGRIAGYVSVYAPGDPGEYAKAAALEYGTSRPRRIFARATRGNRRVAARLTKPVYIRARRFLRGPFEEMAPQIRAELEEALDTAVEDESQ